MNPLVSAIMPAYNGEKYIGESIESVLNQTYDNLELIIVEDQSADCTLEVIQTYKDRRIHLYINEENRGISWSTNFGVDQSKGKYIALLDDDDLALSRRLEWQVAFMEEHDEVDVLGGRSATIDENGNFIKYDLEPIYNPKYIKANLLFYNRKFANGTTMVRRDFMKKNNLKYQENCLGMQDFKFFIDSSKIGTLTSIDRLIHLKRIHKEEETTKRLKYYGKERAELFARFQRESIEKSGFRLNKEDLQAICEILPEYTLKRYSRRDVERLYKAFKEMIKQAREMEIDYLDELEYACKKILGERILPRTDLFDWGDAKNSWL